MLYGVGLILTVGFAAVRFGVLRVPCASAFVFGYKGISKQMHVGADSGYFPAMFIKKPREYIQYSLRFLRHLSKKSLAAASTRFI
jgi:hypothetical protein